MNSSDPKCFKSGSTREECAQPGVQNLLPALPARRPLRQRNAAFQLDAGLQHRDSGGGSRPYNSGAIPARTHITAVGTTTTMSASATGAGVKSGDTILVAPLYQIIEDTLLRRRQPTSWRAITARPTQRPL
jgi:hypothetical protein